MTRNYPYKFRLEPTEEQETLLYHYGFTCRFIYNHALHQRNLSRDPNPVRIMNKTIKFLCWMRRWGAEPRTMGYIRAVWKKISRRADLLESILWCAKGENLQGKHKVGFIIAEIQART